LSVNFKNPENDERFPYQAGPAFNAMTQLAC